MKMLSPEGRCSALSSARCAFVPKGSPRLSMLMLNVAMFRVSGDVDRALDRASIEWFRIAANVWILYTSRDFSWVYEHVRPLAMPAGSALLSRLDLDGHLGLLDSSAWVWIKARTHS